MTIGKNIKIFRELRNFRQDYMAHQLDISQSCYAKIENDISIPKIDRLQKIAEILEVDITSLLNKDVNLSIVFNATANQCGYINNQTLSNVDLSVLQEIIKVEIEKLLKK